MKNTVLRTDIQDIVKIQKKRTFVSSIDFACTILFVPAHTNVSAKVSPLPMRVSSISLPS